jgi:GT2 family glycosyltransferase
VPRLAIIIPAVSTVESLEATLVSVLENRPRDCEVLVVANFCYDDPYSLHDEVRFLTAPGESDFVTCANVGVAATRAPLVHVLAAGCEASEGWADAALAHFRDPRVAAVAPLLLKIKRRQRVLAAGIDYRAGGARRHPAPGLEKAKAAGPRPVFGACGFAGFFRKSVLESIGGWNHQAGTGLADVELAWSLRRLGYLAVCEPESQVLSSAAAVARESAFRQGFYAERTFWRNAGSVGWVKSLAMHPLVVAADSLAHLVKPSVVLRLAGRLWACCQIGDYVRHYHRLNQVEPADVLQLDAIADRSRIDAGHASPKPAGQGQSKRARTA